MSQKLRIAFIHPDLGIGGAERLIVDAALGLQNLGHSVDIYTSHHDPGHCFEETRDGTLRVYYIVPPFPRAIKGKLHIVFSHARQLHLTAHLLVPGSPSYDVYFVDQLSTCIPLLRAFAHTRVLFYCHFPDKLLAEGAYMEGQTKPKGSLFKRIYRLPMDILEEVTTKQADTILANSNFTVRVFQKHMSSVTTLPRVVYPGINLDAYMPPESPQTDPDILQVLSDKQALLSLNRFEQKKNAALAIDAFALLRRRIGTMNPSPQNIRLILAGGYDPRLNDNVQTLLSLLDRAKEHELTYSIVTPSTSSIPLPSYPSSADSEHSDVLFLVNFSMAQRSALLNASSTLALLYTPANEHFGIGPVEGMICGLPVLACDSGGPTESVLDFPTNEKTGWLRRPDPETWAQALSEIISMSEEERRALSVRARTRARERFGMDAMARNIEFALKETVQMGPVPLPISVWVLLAFAVILAYGAQLLL